MKTELIDTDIELDGEVIPVTVRKEYHDDGTSEILDIWISNSGE